MESFGSKRMRVKRLRSQPGTKRFWVCPGRTSACWDNIQAGLAIEEEWKETFRMSRASLYNLAEEHLLVVSNM